jgi:uncharacterized protein YceK
LYHFHQCGTLVLLLLLLLLLLSGCRQIASAPMTSEKCRQDRLNTRIE